MLANKRECAHLIKGWSLHYAFFCWWQSDTHFIAMISYIITYMKKENLQLNFMAAQSQALPALAILILFSNAYIYELWRLI